MDVKLLGPVELVSNETVVALGGPKERALLAMLALEPGLTVSVERLIDGLWGDDPPATAAKLVQLYVSHLRRAMAGCADQGAIATRGGGYELRVGRNQVDAARFERLLAQGAAREALGLWRGSPLADVAKEPFAAPVIRRLEELRTAALEVAIDQDLEAGRHREVLPELEALLAQEPLRERLHAQRMLALYRCGRQADALQAYRQVRATLVEQIGVEPGPALRRLHEAILRQEQSLDAPAAPAGGPGPSTPLLGRDAELERLRSLWWRAREAGGASVLVTGAPGTGKTRLACELAHEVRRERGEVLWFDGEGDVDTALRAATGGRRAERPTLLVLDNLDRAPARVQDVFRKLMGGAPRAPVLVLATATEADGIEADEMFALGGLAPDAAAALARFHAGARDSGALPVDRIVEEAGGVPARVQQAVAEWMREAAMRRLGEAAAHASAERAEWRLAEDDLATSVVEVQGLRERAAAAAGDRRLAGCPFKGLASFDVEDAAVFFGRERLVADMVARLPGARLMGVVGPSGSGKSSAMRAGLLAALAGGVLPGSERWPLVIMRPGHSPIQTLQRATADLPPRGRWVLAVDQFEEVFTACRDEDERAAFVTAVVGCARDARRKALVIVAVRADFYGHCAGYPELSRMLGADHVLVGPMGRHELRRAIELPARYAGLDVEPELVDALIADVEGEPGGLPLLSTALLELWRHRDGRRLRFGAYEQIGGVSGAVARLAEAAYTRLDAGQREQARRILLRLSGEGGVRERVPIAELGDAEAVLDVLASERLIMIGEDEVEVAHEALLREWPRLRGWLEEDADGRRVHWRLTHAARDWDAGGRDTGELYRGARLASALDFASERGDLLNDLEREFLDEARLVSERDAERSRRMNRRLRALLALAVIALVVAGLTGVVALEQRTDARDAATVADAQRLGAQALTDDRLDRALLLARTGVELDDSVATRGNLLATLMRVRPGSLGVLPDVRDVEIYSVAVNPRGDRLAFGDAFGEIQLFDIATRRKLATYRLNPGLVQRVAFSPDGATLAVTSLETSGAPHADTVLDLFDARSLRRRLHVVLPRLPKPIEFMGASPVFTAGGNLAVLQIPFPHNQPEVLRLVDARTGAIARRALRFEATALDPVTTRDRRRVLVTSDREDATYELDAADLHVVKRHPAGGTAEALHPDDRTLALARGDSAIRLLDLRTSRIRRLAGRPRGSVSKMVFTPDGTTLASVGEDGMLLLWDTARGTIRERFAAHTESADGLAVTPDGQTAISAGTDGRVALWNLAGSRLIRSVPLRRPFDVDDFTPRGVAISPDDRTLAVTESDGAVDLVDTATLRRRAVLRVGEGAVLAVDFSPDGRLLAVTGERGLVGLWDAHNLAPVGRLAGLRYWTQAVAFSRDGRLLAAGDTNGDRPSLRIWDVRRRALTSFRSELPINAIAFSPDGRVIAAAAMEKGVEVRDVTTARVVARLRTDELARSVAFAPDGRLLFVGLLNGAGQFYSTRDWRPVGGRIRGQDQRLLNPRFTPDGRTLATSSADGTVLLWDVATRKPIGSPVLVEPDSYVAAAITHHGDHMYALAATTKGIRLALSSQAWKQQACAIAGRELTAREWADALPGRSYRPVCG